MKHWTLNKQFECKVEKFLRKDEINSPTQHWINVELIMQNCSVSQSALLPGFRTDLRHQYGISGRESQTSLCVLHLVAGANEGRLYSQANQNYHVSYQLIKVYHTSPLWQPNLFCFNFGCKKLIDFEILVINIGDWEDIHCTIMLWFKFTSRSNFVLNQFN